MPPLQPAQQGMTINTLTNKVANYLQNRQDVSEAQTNPESRPSAWIRDALKELTANYPFEELRVPDPPLITIGPGLGTNGSSYSYPVNMFVKNGTDLTLSEDPVIFLSPAQGVQGNLLAVNVPLVSTPNLVGYGMDYKTPKAIQPLLFIPGGVPFRYTRYGSQFWFGPQPGSNYNVYLPYQMRHPFSPDLLQSPIYVPEDWFDVVAIAAAERGAAGYLKWPEHAVYLHNLLYGDPMFQKSGGVEGRPGLISAKLFQVERDRRNSPVEVTPFAERY